MAAEIELWAATGSVASQLLAGSCGFLAVSCELVRLDVTGCELVKPYDMTIPTSNENKVIAVVAMRGHDKRFRS
jgi:hypothetical protein